MSIIKIKYIEYLTNHGNIEHSEAVEKEMLVNINCPIRLILDYIRKVVGVKGEYDLCDELLCRSKNVSFYEPCTPGTDILESDATYFIITYERDETGQMINFTPLLTAKAVKKGCVVCTKTRKPLRKIVSKSIVKKRNNAQ